MAYTDEFHVLLFCYCGCEHKLHMTESGTCRQCGNCNGWRGRSIHQVPSSTSVRIQYLARFPYRQKSLLIQ